MSIINSIIVSIFLMLRVQLILFTKKKKERTINIVYGESNKIKMLILQHMLGSLRTCNMVAHELAEFVFSVQLAQLVLSLGNYRVRLEDAPNPNVSFYFFFNFFIFYFYVFMVLRFMFFIFLKK